MDGKKAKIIGFTWILISIGIITYAFFNSHIVLLFIGILSIAVSSIFTMLLPAIAIFKEDKKFDKENALNQGLHIVKCTDCNQDNILEDQYCVHCGAVLVDEDE